jgi:hypothetical protein
VDIKDYKTIIVVFPAGMGGNHLANMISTSPNVANRINTNDGNYNTRLNEYYSSAVKDAHISDIQNVGIFDIDTVYKTIEQADKPFIIAGHIEESYNVFQKIKNLSPFLIIHFEWEALANEVLKRINYDNPLITRWAYREDVISKVFEITNDNMYNINPNNLFKSDITTFLNTINQDLNLDLDLEFCLDLHNKWQRKNIQ